jgi:hypothetical protein
MEKQIRKLRLMIALRVVCVDDFFVIDISSDKILMMCHLTSEKLSRFQMLFPITKVSDNGHIYLNRSNIEIVLT